MNTLFYIVGRLKLLYRIPPDWWFLITIGFLTIWTVLMSFFYEKHQLGRGERASSRQYCLNRRRVAFILNLILMLIGLTIILLVTFVRRDSSEHRVILFPLRVLFGQRAPRDYWHVTLMNIVLYVPFACGSPFCLQHGRGWLESHSALATVLICLLLSLFAETLQYVTGSGLAEVDDVLMNTLGGVLGTIPNLFFRKCRDAF